MATFPVIPVIILFLWVTAGIIAPARLPVAELKQPAAIKSCIVILTVIAGPLVPLFFLLKKQIALQINRHREEKIEQELEYPGQIKVSVIRESRTVDYAK